ncbi:hypothetical protein K469DRAFT_592431, partial [Zopfia rhizophila CBS 207.26]
SSSILVSSTGAVDNGFTLVMFSSNDCNPDMEIAHGGDVDEGQKSLNGDFSSV